MKLKILPILLIAILTSCDQALVKELTIDGSLLFDDFITENEKGFSLNSLQFSYKKVTTNENNDFVFAPGGYISSYHGISYSNLIVETDKLCVYGFDYFNSDENTYVNIEQINYVLDELENNKYLYKIGGKTEFLIKNESSDSITINKLYFYSND